jgi:hypothetical protein
MNRNGKIKSEYMAGGWIPCLGVLFPGFSNAYQTCYQLDFFRVMKTSAPGFKKAKLSITNWINPTNTFI